MVKKMNSVNASELNYSYPLKSKIKTIIFVLITLIALILCIMEMISLNTDERLIEKGLVNYKLFVNFFMFPLVAILFASSLFYMYNNFTEIFLYSDKILIKKLLQKDSAILLNEINDVSYTEWFGKLKIADKKGISLSVFLHLEGFRDFVERTQKYYKNFVGIDFSEYENSKSKK